jgi:PAS domain S-box-containing protein
MNSGADREPAISDAGSGLRVSDVLDALPFYVLLVDDQHRILQANSALLRDLGLETETIVGGYCPKVVHDLDHPWPCCPLEEAVEKGGQAVVREALDRGSGRWIRSAVYPTTRFTTDGSRIYFHTVADITEARETEAELRVSREQLRELSRYLESVREDERTKMSREIHDELGQVLTAVKIDLSSMAGRLTEDQDPLLNKVESMRGLIDMAIQIVKRVSTELRPGALDDLGLADALEWLTEAFGKRTGIRSRFSASPRDIVIDRERSTALFRICQEALTNVVRHADATRVTVGLKRTIRRVTLRISDDGRGMNEAQIRDPRAFGLIGMRERASSWGGDVEFRGIPGRGTTVLVRIPLATRREPRC